MAKRRSRGVTKSGGGVSLDIHGDRELIDALSKLAVGMRTKVLRAAMRKGMDLVTAAVRAAAPVRTGRLRNSIETANGKTNSKWKVRVLTRPRSGLYKGDAYYAAFVEFGTKKMAARPYMTPAFDANKARAVAVAREEILLGVEDAVWWASFRKTGIGRVYTKAGRRYRKASRTLGRARKTTARSAKRLRKRATRVGKRARRATTRVVRRNVKSVRRNVKSIRRNVKAARRSANRNVKAARKRLRTARKSVARTRKAVAKRVRKATRPRRRRGRRR